MIHTGRASRLFLLLFFILMLSLSTSAVRIQAATAVVLLPQRVLASNLSPNGAGMVTEYPIPTPGSQPVGITSGPCGDGTLCLWFTESTGNKIGKITTSGQISEYPLPFPAAPASAEPEGITSGPCGDGTQCLWFTEFSSIYGNKIGKMTTRGQVTLYSLPTASSEPDNIALGLCGDGSQCLWFTEFNNDKIGKITTGGQITEYTVPTVGSEPECMA